MVRVAVQIDTNKRAEVEALCNAYAIVIWYFGDINVKARQAGAKMAHITIDIDSKGSLSQRFSCNSPVNMVVGIPDAISNRLRISIEERTRLLIRGSGLGGSSHSLRSQPTPAEIDGAFRTLRKYLPPVTSLGKPTYHFKITIPAEVEISRELTEDTPESREKMMTKILKEVPTTLVGYYSAPGRITCEPAQAKIVEVRKEERKYPGDL